MCPQYKKYKTKIVLPFDVYSLAHFAAYQSKKIFSLISTRVHCSAAKIGVQKIPVSVGSRAIPEVRKGCI